MHRLLCSSALAVALVMVASPLWAQQSWRPERPYRGLFGGGTAGASQLLTASGSLSGGFDDNVLADSIGSGFGGAGRAGRARGGVAQTSASLNYSWDANALSLGASAGTSARYFPSLGSTWIRAVQGQVNAKGTLAQRVSFRAAFMGGHQPYLFGSLFAREDDIEDAGEPDLDLASATDYRLHYAFSGSLGMSHPLTSRTSLSGNYGFRGAHSSGVDGYFTRHSLSSGITHNISKGLRFHGGYGYREARYPSGERNSNHGFNVGLDFNRALSLTRRTTLGFSTGSTLTGNEENRRFRLTGHVQLSHELGRTWTTFVTYGRDTTFHENFDEPVFSDSATVGVSGFISRRLQFGSSVSASHGFMGNSRRGREFQNYRANTTLGMAISRFMNAGVVYSYYQHHFDQDVLLGSRLPRDFERNSIRGVISLWAPLYQRAGRTNASR